MSNREKPPKPGETSIKQLAKKLGISGSLKEVRGTRGTTETFHTSEGHPLHFLILANKTTPQDLFYLHTSQEGYYIVEINEADFEQNLEELKEKMKEIVASIVLPKVPKEKLH